MNSKQLIASLPPRASEAGMIAMAEEILLLERTKQGAQDIIERLQILADAIQIYSDLREVTRKDLAQSILNEEITV